MTTIEELQNKINDLQTELNQLKISRKSKKTRTGGW